MTLLLVFGTCCKSGWLHVLAILFAMIALPVAAGALLPGLNLLLSPPLAALLMALSSLSVVLNALSLRLR